MKLQDWIGLWMIAVLAACSSCSEPKGSVRPADTSLVAIDSLLWTQPDSAFAQLQDFDANRSIDSLDTFNRHYFHLLLSELLYKNYCEQSNRSDLLNAVDCFDSLVEASGNRVHPDIAFLDARVHYINGAGYYEMDSVVPACEQYLKALEVMEERFSEKELVGKKAQFMAMAYTRLTKLYSDQYLHEQAIAFGKQSLPYYHKYCAEPWHEAWILDAIGMHYHMMDEMDSAYQFYLNAYDRLPDTVGLMYRDIKMHMLQLFHVEGLSTPQEVIAQMHSLLDAAESEKEYYARCFSIGDFFYIERQFDSAWPYLNKVFFGTTSIAFKKQTAEWLVQICKELGKNEESVAYADYLVPFANQEENESTMKTRLTKLYSDYESARQFDLRHQRIGVMRKWGRGAFFTICLLALGLVVFFFWNRKKHLLLENELKGKAVQQSATIKEINANNKRLQEENKELKEKQSETERCKAPAWEYENLLREEICIIIWKRMEKAKKYSSYYVKDYKALFLSKQECADLYRVIDSYCPDFSKRLNKLFPNLNNNDIKLCHFYLLGLSMLQTAILLGTDYSSIRKRTIRIEEKMGDRNLHPLIKTLFFDS